MSGHAGASPLTLATASEDHPVGGYFGLTAVAVDNTALGGDLAEIAAATEDAYKGCSGRSRTDPREKFRMPDRLGAMAHAQASHRRHMADLH